MLKEQKGITLVALIITIIVLIILAGVSITIALGNNGIFKKANKAGSEYQNASKNEMNELGNTSNTMNELWDEYLPGVPKE